MQDQQTEHIDGNEQALSCRFSSEGILLCIILHINKDSEGGMSGLHRDFAQLIF
jgi:hypothetical protein